MPDTSAQGREANDRSAREAADKVRQLKSQDEMRRRQVRLDKMAAVIYAGMHAKQEPGRDDDEELAVQRAIALAAAVDKALGIAP